MKKLILLTISLLLLHCNIVLAQLYQDAGGVAITVHSKSEIKTLPNGSPLTGRKFSFITYDIWTPFPFFKVGKAEVFSTLNYRMLDINYDQNISLDPNRPDKIHEVKSVIFIKYPLAKSWSLVGLAMPSLASDFRAPICNDDVLLQGALAITKKIGIASDLEIGLGLFATYVFGELQFIPAFTLNYESANGKWIGQAYWPRFSMLYNVNKNSQFGFAASIDGTEYNLKNYIDLQGESIDNADFTIIHTGLQYNRRMYKDFWLQVQGGIAMGNQYQLFDSNNEEIVNADYSLKDMTYAKVMMTYRFDTNKINK
jgi:Domain of unknown function (DUF6268)